MWRVLEGDVFIEENSIHSRDFITLEGLLVPLKGAQTAEPEREADEEVLLEVFHRWSGAALTAMATCEMPARFTKSKTKITEPCVASCMPVM
jgi:hypothetical protein